MDNTINHPKSIDESHHVMSYDEWFKKTKRPHVKGSYQSLQDYRNYQFNVEQHSVSSQIEQKHREQLQLSRLKTKSELVHTRCYLDTSGASFVFEPSPVKGVVKMTNQDITIWFDNVLNMNKHQVQLFFQKQIVGIIQIKSELKFNQIKSVLAKSRA